MRIGLGLDPGGRTEAWVFGRQGCVVFAMSRGGALEQLPARVTEYDRWLRSHGFPLPDQPPGRTEVVEEVAVREPLFQGNTAAFFEADREVVGLPEIERTLDLVTASRQDVLGLTQGLPSELLAEEPSDGGRSISQILRHIAAAEWWYVSRIVDFPTPEPGRCPSEVFTLLPWVRERVADRLRNLSVEERGRIVVPDAESGEQWSARKVLRRLVYHELYHLRQLRRRLGVA